MLKLALAGQCPGFTGCYVFWISPLMGRDPKAETSTPGPALSLIKQQTWWFSTWKLLYPFLLGMYHGGLASTGSNQPKEEVGSPRVSILSISWEQWEICILNISNTFKFFSKFCSGQTHPEPMWPIGHHCVTSYLPLPCPFLRTARSLPYTWACWACECSVPTILLLSPHCVRAITDANGVSYVPWQAF